MWSKQSFKYHSPLKKSLSLFLNKINFVSFFTTKRLTDRLNQLSKSNYQMKQRYSGFFIVPETEKSYV